MMICFMSNYLNNHVLNVCNAFRGNPDVGQFWFIETDPMDKQRIDMGFVEISSGKEWVIKARQEPQKAECVMLKADVVIYCSGGENLLKQRMDQNKLTFRCSERFFKLGLWRRFVPSSYKKKKEQFLQYKYKNFYYLCMGAYTPFDLQFCGFPLDKCFQWAYFPKIMDISYEKIEEKQKGQGKLTVCWAARMIDVKHPEKAIQIARKLKQKKIAFKLTMVGSGKLLNKARTLIEKLNLQNEVKALGNCTPLETQRIMQQSQVFLFTSDYCEGWGAVLNESMGLGCVPVSSSKAGATRYLVNQDKNGFCFETEDEAVEALAKLAQSETLRDMLAKNAYKTIAEDWDARVAVRRFVKISKSLLAGQKSETYAEGPMAKAIIRHPKNYLYTDF